MPEKFSPRTLLTIVGVIAAGVFAWAAMVSLRGDVISMRSILPFAFAALTTLVSLGFVLMIHLRAALAGQVWSKLAARNAARAALVAFFLVALPALIPAERFGGYAKYFALLQPLLFAAAIVAGLLYAVTLIASGNLPSEGMREALRAQKSALRIALGIFLLALVVWAGIAFTGWGVRSGEDYWFGAGSPLLFQQLLIGLLAAILFAKWGDRLPERIAFGRSHISLDALIFVVIWAIAALSWAAQPTPASFMAPRPMPPNEEIYPYADAVRFDLGGQFALIGQGLNNGQFYYRIFFMGYLFVMRALFGQDYSSVVTAQAALFAIFPALVYLLGRRLWNRSFGIAAAAAVLFSGMNSILAGDLVDMANPKQMLTDFPTAIAIAGFLLLLTIWLARTENASPLLWAAGLVGAASLVRTSALGLLAPLLALTFLLRSRPWRGRVALSVAAGVVFLAAALPWSVHFGRLPTDLYSIKIVSVIYNRYIDPKYAPPAADDALETEASTEGEIPSRTTPALQAMTEHYLHGLTTSTLVMPPSLAFHEVGTVVREAFPYWSAQWDGSLDAASALLIAANLLLFSLGVAFAVRTSGLAGALPLGVHLLYTAVNSAARTSGGRYSAPVDWIFLFYFTWGCLVIVTWLRSGAGTAMAEPHGRSPEAAAVRPLFAMSAPPFVLFASLGTLMILASGLFPQRYQAGDAQAHLDAFMQAGFPRSLGLEEAQFEAFLDHPQAVVLSGRALYPRYFLATQGFGGLGGVYQRREYPRLIFSLLGPQGHTTVVFPGVMPQSFPNASDVFVLGCRTDKRTMDALVVILLAEPRALYAVPSSVEFDCPLRAKE